MGFSTEGLLGMVEGYKKGQRRRLLEQERREDRSFDRSLREAQEERAESEEGRRGERHEQGTETYEHGVGRRGVTEGREDTQYGRDTEAYEHGQERRPILEGREDTEYRQSQDAHRMGLIDEERQRKESIEDRARGDIEYERGEEVAKQGMTDWRNRIGQEGAVDLVNALASGGDVRRAISEYNKMGVAKIIPESVKFEYNKENPGESIISFEEEDDDDPNTEERFEGTLNQMDAVLGHLGEGQDTFSTVAKGAAIYNDRTGRIVAQNRGKATDKEGNRLSAGGFTNPQARAYEKNVDNLISQGMGGKYDSFTGKYSIPEDNMEMKNMLGDLAGQITRRIIEGQIATNLTPAEINDAVMSAKDLLLTADSALAKAEKLAGDKKSWHKFEAAEFDNQTREQWTKAKAETLYLEARAKAEKRIQQRISSRVKGKQRESGEAMPVAKALKMLAKDPSLRESFIEIYGEEALPK